MALPMIRQDQGLTVSPYAQWNFNRRIVSPGRDGNNSSNPNDINNEGRSTGLDSNRFASAKAFLICSGPPLFSHITSLEEEAASQQITPIGLVQDVNLQQERAVSEIYEIGSRSTYYMVGRGTRRLSLSSIVYDGANLVRALYAHTQAEFPGPEQPFDQKPASMAEDLFFSNLDSSFFEASTGIYLRVESLADANQPDRDLNEPNQIGGMYLEECYVRAYGLTANANNTVVAENTVITFARVVPVTPTTIRTEAA